MITENKVQIPVMQVEDPASEKRYETSAVLSGLFNKYRAILHPQAGLKLVTNLQTRFPSEKECDDIIAEAEDLFSHDLNRQQFSKLLTFIERHATIPIEEQLQTGFERVDQNLHKIFTHVKSLDLYSNEIINILYVFYATNKKHPNVYREIFTTILHASSDVEILAATNEVLQRIENDTLVTTSTLSPTMQLASTEIAALKEKSIKNRIKFSKKATGEQHIQIDVLPSETIKILDMDSNTVPHIIIAPGTYIIPQTAQLVLEAKSAQTNTVILLSEPETINVLSSKDDSRPEKALLSRAFSMLWQWHRSEHKGVTAELIPILQTELTSLLARENIGHHKSILRSTLAEMTAQGFPPEFAVELLDQAEGLACRSWLLDAELITYLEKEQRLSKTEWETLFSVANDRSALIQLLTDWKKSGLLLSMEGDVFLRSAESTIPGDTITTRAAEFSKMFPEARGLRAPLQQYCYSVAASDNAQFPPIQDFFTEVYALVLKHHPKGIEKNALRSIFTENAIALKWLYGKITRNYTEVRNSQLSKLCGLEMHEEVEVSGVAVPRLRFDIEQHALVIKASLKEILPASLHRYLQIKNQQGSFSREYILPLDSNPEVSLLGHLCFAYCTPTDLRNGFLPARQVEDALLRFSLMQNVYQGELTTHSQDALLAGVCNSLEQNASSTVCEYLFEHLQTTSAYQEVAAKHPQKQIFKDRKLTTEVLRTYLASPKIAETDEQKKFERILNAVIRQVADRLHTEKTSKGIKKAVPMRDSLNKSLLKQLFTQAKVTATGFHGWGANDESITPFAATLAEETGGSTLIIANNYMGGDNTNLLPIEGVGPISVAEKGQDMVDYGTQLVKIMAELDGVAETDNIIFGHSMGGFVVLMAALAFAEQWQNTTFTALEPVCSTASRTIQNPKSLEKIINHYILLLGVSKGEQRPLTKKLAAIITRLVTSPDSRLSEMWQDLLVFLGRIGINTAVYSQLVENSDPRVARSHFIELIKHRKNFHRHATQMLETVREISPDEKKYMTEKLHSLLSIVIAENDDVLQADIAKWEFFTDPRLPEEVKQVFLSMVLLLTGNHYGHLEREHYNKSFDQYGKSNQQIVAERIAGGRGNLGNHRT